MRLGIELSGLGDVHAGVARHVWGICRELLRTHDIDIIFFAKRQSEIPLPAGRWRLCVDTPAAWMPYHIWLQQRYPILLAQNDVRVCWFQNQLVPLRLIHGCRRLMTLHDLTAVLFPRTMSFYNRLSSRLLLRKAVRVADVVVAVSQATARLAVRLLAVDPEKITVVYNGCYHGLTPVSRDIAAQVIREAYGLEPGYLLTVGTLEPRKDYMTLLRALDSLDEMPLLVVVGAVGWRSRTIREAIRSREPSGRVRYIGYVADEHLPALYSAARLLVYPSLYEGFGLPVLEAMACGCPVLCSDSSSLPEVGGEAVCYFRMGDHKDLARRLQELLSDEERLRAMSAAGLLRAKQFSFRRAAEEMLTIIREGVARLKERPFSEQSIYSKRLSR